MDLYLRTIEGSKKYGAWIRGQRKSKDEFYAILETRNLGCPGRENQVFVILFT